MTQESREQAVTQRLGELPISWDEDAPRRLVVYQEMLEDWNTRMNLTGDASFDVVLDKHIMDSLAPLSIEGLFQKGAALIDVGSGAGFPGLPLAIVRPDLRVTLLDSLGKRVGFLKAVIEELGLSNAQALHARAEDGAREPGLREVFDIAVARAVAPVSVLCELLLPFARVEGRMVCYKGPAALDELEAGNRAAGMLGGGELRLIPVLLPRLPDLQHAVLISEKRKETLRQYPRKAGTPARAPLGGFDRK